MPLLGRKEHQAVPLPDDLKDDDLVFVIPYTGEIFREYEEYLQKAQAYDWPQWSCSLTGKSVCQPCSIEGSFLRI
jgi:hypothetical protein